ncbi:ATP-binding protein [Streptomyces sp. NPDC059786]|uniref:ATP-binding protein n=1 Tax=Streptomyces sp. NPDC059786 TaxID=3346946 RepID=UPI003659E582
MTACGALNATSSVLWRWTSRASDVPARARVTLRCALDQLGFDEEVIDDAVLAVSEFVTNAITHAVGPYEMRLRRTAAGIVCEVEDHDPRIPETPVAPVMAPYAPVEENRGGGLEALCALLSEHERGLHIVHELTKGSWGFRGCKGTKTAWFAVGGGTSMAGAESHDALRFLSL